MDVDVPDAVAAARSVGITRLITVGDSVESSQWCADTAASFDDVWAAVAIHPNHADAANDAALATIDRLACLPQVRAVGETGLDYYWGRVEPTVQAASFRAHIPLLLGRCRLFAALRTARLRHVVCRDGDVQERAVAP
jgi:TatD DNase family protein